MGRFTSATLISRVLGFARDALVAHIFGGEVLTDAFYTAFRTSNLLRGLLAEGAMSSSFIPVFSRALKHDSREEVQDFLNSTFTVLTTVLVAVVVLGMIFSRQLTHVVAPGFEANPAKFAMTVEITRWIFPFFLFICLSAFLSGALNSLKHFFVPAVAPAMLSVMQIAYLLGFARRSSVETQMIGLAVAVVLGGAAHFLLQVPILRRDGFSLGWRWQWRHPHLLEVGKLMAPAIIGLSVDQVNGFVDTICASFLVRGSVTALYNSNRIMQLPLALFGIGVATVSLPTLSDHSADRDYAELNETLHASLRLMFFAVAPAAVGLILLARPVIVLLFQHGKFTPFATGLTVSALRYYCLGLLAYSAAKVLAGAFYSLHDTRTPVRIAAVSMLLNVVLNLLLMVPLGVGGLALATAISSWVNAAWLYVLLVGRMRGHLEGTPGTGAGMRLAAMSAKTLLACLVMGSFLWLLPRFGGSWPVFLQVLAGVAGGGALFLACSTLLGIREQRLVLSMLGLAKG